MNRFESSFVLDLGSGSIKSGIGGDDFPQSIIKRSMTDQCRHHNQQSKKETPIDFKYPIQRGIISDLNNLENIIQFMIKDFTNCEMKEMPILIGFNSLKNVKSTRVGIAEIVFEKFGNPMLSLVDRSILSLLAMGRMTGLIFHSGEGVTQSAPILNLQILKQYCNSIDFGGMDLDLYMEKIFSEFGYNIGGMIDSATGVEHVKQAKEKCCQLSLDYQCEAQRFDICEKHYDFGDDVISFGLDQFKCPEALFQPSLVDRSEQLPIHELIVKSLQSLDPETKLECEKAICLSGGNTLFPNFADRLKKELNLTKVISAPERAQSPWIGGSIFTCMRGTDETCVKKEEFEEYGSSIIHRKYI